MILPVDIAEVHEIMPETYSQQVMIVCETQMHRAPYLFEDEGWEKSRLKAAVALVLAHKVTATPEGYVVQGTTPYTIPSGTLACPCKAAQHGKTTVCKHRVAVELYRRVQQAYPPPLPLGPVTVDERLALGALRDSTAMSTHHTPQEDRMPDADDGYTPEPDDAPTAVLEPPAAIPATRPLPGPVLLPSLDARTLEQSMQAYAAQRQVVTRYIKEQMTEGVDYYTLTIKGRVSKATLSKAGSEKFLSLFQLHAAFQQDVSTWQMLGSKEGLLCYTCTLMTRSGEVIGEGRGARSVSQDGGDINKAIKMATKSAQVDAILRTGALSDVFTQDLEPEDRETAPPATAPARTTSADLRSRIWQIVQARAPEVKSREAVEAYIVQATSYALIPDNYRAILATLDEVGR